MAAAALFLACKANDMPIRVDHLCRKFYQLEVERKRKINPSFQAQPFTEATQAKLVVKVTDYEMWLLVTCECSVFPELPYRHLQELCGSIDPAHRELVLRVSTNFANDSFRSPICLVKSAYTVAQTCVHLAGRYLGLDLGIEADLQAVVIILELYNTDRPQGR
jgi:hypothetical protein